MRAGGEKKDLLRDGAGSRGDMSMTQQVQEGGDVTARGLLNK